MIFLPVTVVAAPWEKYNGGVSIWLLPDKRLFWVGHRQISQMYLSRLQNVFVQISECICPKIQFMCHALPSATQVIKPHMSHMADRIYIYIKNRRYMCYKIREILIIIKRLL